MLGKNECKRRRKQQMMRWLDSITDSMDMNLSKLWKIKLPENVSKLRERQGSLVYRGPWDHKESDTTKRLNSKASI